MARHHFPALCFLLLTCLPLVATALGVRPTAGDIRSLEKRRPAEAPDRPDSFDELEAWPDAFDSYWNDRFGLRRQLIQVQGTTQLLLRRSGPFVSERREILIGEDGWLFLNNENDLLFQHLGRKTLEADEMARWVRSIDALKELSAGHGADLIFAMVPDKHSVYADKLPAWVRQRMVATPADRLMEELGDRPYCLSLKEFLVGARRESDHLLYAKTDSHWTSLGAFLAYRELMDHLGGPYQLGEEWETYEVYLQSRPGRDLAKLIGVESVTFEDVVRTRRGLTQKSKIDPPRRVLFIRDSFGIAMRPNLRGQFGPHVDEVHIRDLERVPEMVASGEYDLVLWLIVERLIGGAPEVADRLFAST